MPYVLTKKLVFDAFNMASPQTNHLFGHFLSRILRNGCLFASNFLWKINHSSRKPLALISQVRQKVQLHSNKSANWTFSSAFVFDDENTFTNMGNL